MIISILTFNYKIWNGKPEPNDKELIKAKHIPVYPPDPPALYSIKESDGKVTLTPLIWRMISPNISVELQ